VALTFFFRDLLILHAIRDHVIPEIRRYKYINVWDAGCAMGPEPYSLAIIFKEALNSYEFKRLRIFATDLDEESRGFGKILRAGVYPEKTVKRIPEEIFHKYFTSSVKPGHYKICDEIIHCVSFQRHDLRSLQPVRDGFGLIVCKNVLLHMQETQREDIIKMFHRCLVPGGFFATEQIQRMPAELSGLFKQVRPNIRLFRRV